jgi:D-alanyl-D-alanine carboxypeptidase (penicillin-binding protein 5/6)
MNRKARELGMTSSHFMNPHGLNEPGQYSTARDMSRAAFRAYRNNTLRQMMMMRHYAFRHSNGRTSMLETTNKLLGQTPYVNGMKTGYTVAAGRCLVTSGSLPSGRELILVQLGSNTRNIFRDAATMFNWANREFPVRGPAFAQVR